MKFLYWDGSIKLRGIYFTTFSFGSIVKLNIFLLRPPLFCMFLSTLWTAVEQCESGEEETMETLVAADSLLNMDCPDTLSLEHYCKHRHAPG